MNILTNKKFYRTGGRHITVNDVLFLSYSASYIEFKFKGTKAVAVLRSDGYDGTKQLLGWVAVFVDGAVEPYKRFPVKKGSAEYVLYDEAESREVIIRLMKYSETVFGTVGIESIDVDGEVCEIEPSDRKLLEFVGDSITCGYGIEAVCGEGQFTTATENPWTNYAGLLARALDMDYQCISWSGNGVISHYQDGYYEKPRVENFFLQELYPFADAELERKLGVTEYTPWYFERQADLVIINIGTNDSSYTRDIEERNLAFEAEYRNLLKLVRENNPDADIVCILGVMEQCLVKQISHVVESCKADGDNRVYFLECDLQDEADGYATDFHPSLKTHTKLAAYIEGYIREIIHDI